MNTSSDQSLILSASDEDLSLEGVTDFNEFIRRDVAYLSNSTIPILRRAERAEVSLRMHATQVKLGLLGMGYTIHFADADRLYTYHGYDSLSAWLTDREDPIPLEYALHARNLWRVFVELSQDFADRFEPTQFIGLTDEHVSHIRREHRNIMRQLKQAKRDCDSPDQLAEIRAQTIERFVEKVESITATKDPTQLRALFPVNAPSIAGLPDHDETNRGSVPHLYLEHMMWPERSHLIKCMLTIPADPEVWRLLARTLKKGFITSCEWEGDAATRSLDDIARDIEEQHGPLSSLSPYPGPGGEEDDDF